MSPEAEAPLDPTEDPAAFGSPNPAEESPSGFAAADSAAADATRRDDDSVGAAGHDDAPVEAPRKKKAKRRGSSRRGKKSARAGGTKKRSTRASDDAVADDDNAAFPFLGDPGDSRPNDVEIAVHDETIAGLGDEEWMRTIETDGAAAVAMAAAEVAAAARLEANAEDGFVPPRSAAPGPPQDSAAPAPGNGAASRFVAFARSLLGAQGARGAVRRSAIAAGLAVAAGLGYGAAVHLFFDAAPADLSAESEPESDAAPTPRETATPPAETLEPAAHAAAPDAAPDAALRDSTGEETLPSVEDASAAGSEAGAEPAAQPGTDAPVEGTAKGEGEAAATDPAATAAADAAPVKVETRLVGPEQPFAMPELGSSLPRRDHPLTKGRERLDRGDLEAARRTAADFLLREDGLSSEDRLFVAQAYALLADTMKVELDRSRADAKRAAASPNRAATRPLPGGTEEGQ